MQTNAAAARDFKIRDASSYDPVTALFDRFTERFTRVIARQMIELAQLGAGDRVLDVGAGTGVVAIEAARVTSKPVCGIDLSSAMLQRAAANAKARRLTNVSFDAMDAEALQFQDASFEVLFSLFALLHFPNPVQALAEMFRVLRPGGRIVVAVGSGPPLASPAAWGHIAGRLAEAPARAMGKLLVAPALLNSLVARMLPGGDAPEETALAAAGRNRSRSVPHLVRQAGFTNVRCLWRGYREVIATPEEFWDLQRTYSSFARKRLAAAEPGRADAVRAECLAQCRRAQQRGGSLVYHYAALYVAAQRPDH